MDLIKPDITFVIQAVNFLVALAIVYFMIIKPILGIIDKRNEHLAGMLADAESFSESAESKIKSYEAALLEARAAGTDERNKFKDEGVAEEKKLVEAAHKDAADTMAQARDTIAGEVKTAMESLKGQVDSLADKLTVKVLG